MSNVTVVGLGYVGLPLAVRAAEVGHDVTGFDLDAAKVVGLSAGHSYIEDVTDERLAAVIASGRFRARTVEPPPFDLAIIAVPTPMRGDTPDLSYVASAGSLVGRALPRTAPYATTTPTVVLESTTYPGTTENLLRKVLEDASGLVAGRDFHLGYSPERIDPGASPYTLENTPKIVSATTPEGLAAIQAFYDTIVDTTVAVSSPKVAETAKIFENHQANVLIAVANEMATLCHDLGIDFTEVEAAAMTKGHSMSHWTPGPGVGGHCLPVDPLYLAWLTRTELGRPLRFAELADEVNKGRPRYVAERIKALLERHSILPDTAEALVLGTAYKPGVGDLRESPAIDVVKHLTDRRIRVTACDPHVLDWTLTPTISIEDLPNRLGDFDVVVIVTAHPTFDWEKIATRSNMILDCQNVLPAAENVEIL